MNFLAHAFLSCNQDHLLVGNFLADLIQKKNIATLPASVQLGIDLHHKIDTFTDQHEVVLQSVRRLYPFHHKYASVVVDIFYDHFLSINWEQYTRESLSSFTTKIYKKLIDHIGVMPEEVQNTLPRMVEDDWLMTYGTEDGLAQTFERVKRRVSKPEQLDGVITSLHRDFDALNKEFQAFFPELQVYVNDNCWCD